MKDSAGNGFPFTSRVETGGSKAPGSKASGSKASGFKKGKPAERRRKHNDEDGSYDGTEDEISPVKEYSELPAPSLGALIDRELERINTARFKSGHLKGTTHKIIKTSGEKLRAQAQALVNSAVDLGDGTRACLAVACSELEKSKLEKQVRDLQGKVRLLRQ